MLKFKRNKNQKGFSLPEMLIVFAILSIVLSAITGYFISVVRTQSYILASQQLYDQTSYAMDYMYKMARMAKKSSVINGVPETCVTVGQNFTPANPLASSNLQFIRIDRSSGSSVRVCQKFELVGGVIKATVDGVVSDLTSNDIEVTNLSLSVTGDGGTSTGDKDQPRVTILIRARSKNIPSSTVYMQTTVSQRDLDVDM